jgi:glycerol kinase
MFNHTPVELTEMNAVTTEAGRKYRTPEGVDLPSITTVLSLLSRDGIAAWRKKVGEEEANRISHRASTRGTKVHEIIEKYVDNDPNYRDGYTPDIIASFQDVKPILDNNIGDVFAQEAPLYSNHLGVAGRVDCVIMWEERTGMPIVQLVTIISVDNNEPQVFIEHRDNWIRPLQDVIKQYKDEQESSLFV